MRLRAHPFPETYVNHRLYVFDWFLLARCATSLGRRIKASNLGLSLHRASALSNPTALDGLLD